VRCRAVIAARTGRNYTPKVFQEVAASAYAAEVLAMSAVGTAEAADNKAGRAQKEAKVATRVAGEAKSDAAQAIRGNAATQGAVEETSQRVDIMEKLSMANQEALSTMHDLTALNAAQICAGQKTLENTTVLTEQNARQISAGQERLQLAIAMSEKNEKRLNKLDGV
jgi:hypothetical protein